jgi:hypothetical protein
MKQIVVPATAAVAILLAAAGAAFALTGGSDDEPGSGGAELARCTADAPNCDDTPGEGGSDGGALGVCVEGVPDCVDTVVNPGGDEPSPDEPVSSDPNSGPTSGDGIDPNECSLTHNIDRCQEQAVALVTEDLVVRTGAEPILVSAESVEWPDTSLGNPQPGMFYAQVITPGFKIILEAGGAQYEYHTDLAGNFTLLD